MHLCSMSGVPALSAQLEALGVERLRHIACRRDAGAQSVSDAPVSLISDLAPLASFSAQEGDAS